MRTAMHDKKKIDLTGVPQTLLLPLIGRAKYSKMPYSPIYDDKAIQIVESLYYDFDRLLNVKNVKQTTLFWIARAYHFDNAIKNYLKDYPAATIVNLGCGLDTTFHRINNGRLSWVDIDLPDVIKLRNDLLAPTNQEKYIMKSILDFSWIEEVKQQGKDVFFFAGGVFMYFTHEQVKSIFTTMANHFPGANLIFDNISPKGLQYANKMLQDSDMKDAVLQWSIYNGKELEAWSPKIKVFEQMPYFKEIKKKYKFPISAKLIMYYYDWEHKNGIIHLKFAT